MPEQGVFANVTTDPMQVSTATAMWVYIESKVKPGCEDAFAAVLKDRLVPLWTTFPDADEVRVLRQKESDTPELHYAMVLTIRYPSLATIEEALNSDVRRNNREETAEDVQMFEDRIFHTVFEVPHAT